MASAFERKSFSDLFSATDIVIIIIIQVENKKNPLTVVNPWEACTKVGRKNEAYRALFDVFSAKRPECFN